MSYKVLYRKWRPKTFDDVVAQSHVTDILKSQIKHDRIPHALMFCGSRGTGKTSCARIFAKSINCLDNIDGNPCLKCEICKKIEDGKTFDICEIDAASNNGVENIRTINEESNFVSSDTKYKVYIIDEFHMLSSGAYNAFLKTLEDPPKNVVFILATTEFNKIPKTIVSRCQKFDFHRININSMKERLKFICKQENINITDESLSLICKNADGALRDALSILDQCLNEDNNININDVENILGISNSNYANDLIENILSGNLKESINIIENLYFHGNNLTKECEFLMNYFYDIFYHICSGEFLENSLNDETFISDFSSRISLDDCMDCFRFLEDSYIQMSKSLSKKAELEIAIIKIFNKLNKSTRNNHVIKEVKEIKAPENNKKVEKKSNPDSVELDKWNEIVDSIRDISISLFETLKGSKAYIKENSILVDTNEFVFGMVKKNYSQIESIVKEKTGKLYKISRLEDNESPDEKSKVDLFVEKAVKSDIDVKIN